MSIPADCFPNRPDDLRLEIGFGGGEHLAADAQAHPERGYFGCEPFVNGVAKLLAEIETRDLRNIRVHPGDAGDLIDVLPAAACQASACFIPILGRSGGTRSGGSSPTPCSAASGAGDAAGRGTAFRH